MLITKEMTNVKESNNLFKGFFFYTVELPVKQLLWRFLGAHKHPSNNIQETIDKNDDPS